MAERIHELLLRNLQEVLERVTLPSAALPSRNSTRMTVYYMYPQVPSLGTVPWINLQLI
jgi:hypothetical protein